MLEKITHRWTKPEISPEEKIALAQTVEQVIASGYNKDTETIEHAPEKIPESSDKHYEQFIHSIKDLRTQVDLLKTELDTRAGVVEFIVKNEDVVKEIPKNIEEDMCDSDPIADYQKKVQAMVKTQEIQRALEFFKQKLPSLDKEIAMQELHDLENQITILEKKVFEREKIVQVDHTNN